ncbi:MAG: alpha-mannosyltransferase [Deltaproteobacteria bacterium CG11_big_fil_rev_8_21_14_0_20_45_16]|nr:MAG: alpha-mannosyltransferase [Deltaproteobacteria bacterium CG11_big_fil_rev_8_21_14_0_20_45_16]
MRILIATDAWLPQINGVVRSIQNLITQLQKKGHQVDLISPLEMRSWACPSYPEIRLAMGVGSYLAANIEPILEEYDSIHIATEGPIGWAMRRLCLRYQLSFTTAYHTKFPEYVYERWQMPMRWSRAFLRRFHSASSGVMVSTMSLKRELQSYGFKNLDLWSRGVDTDLFRPETHEKFFSGPGPHLLYVGRLAVEKNIEAFLNLPTNGTKHIVGEGPLANELKRKYPEAKFYGAKVGAELAKFYAQADLFVFPSLTDTFGLVLLEALACGTPVAAFSVAGPKDVIRSKSVGVLNQDLSQAVRLALQVNRAECRSYAERFSWAQSAEQFLDNLVEASSGKTGENPQKSIFARTYALAMQGLRLQGW